MSGWNKRYVPYPLLAPWTSDYHTGIGFGVKIPHSTRDDKGNLNLTVQYELNSKYLKGLVESGKAKYLSVIECNRTFSRLSNLRQRRRVKTSSLSSFPTFQTHYPLFRMLLQHVPCRISCLMSTPTRYAT